MHAALQASSFKLTRTSYISERSQGYAKCFAKARVVGLAIFRTASAGYLSL
jgi:hypothetical protein